MIEYRIEEARPFHAGRMIRHMRKPHLMALCRAGGDPHKALRNVLDQSSFRRAAFIENRLVALWGVTGTLAAAEGAFWLAVSDEAVGHTGTFIRECRRQIADIRSVKSVVTTVVAAADPAARRMAAYFGFRPVPYAARNGYVEMRLDDEEEPTGPAPFVVFSLPRSRTKWLSCFLSYGYDFCDHDLPVELKAVSELRERLSRSNVGTVETGLTRAWPLIRRWFPNARFAVIRRPISGVVESAGRVGWTFPKGYLEAEQNRLDEISCLPGTLTLTFDDLDTEDGCRRIFTHCLRRRFDRHWWLEFAGRNLQIDIDQRNRDLEGKGPQLFSFFRQVMARAVPVTYQAEDFETFYRDGQGLFAEHEAEGVKEGDGRAVRPNIDVARRANLLCVTARSAGVMVGYIVFMITPAFDDCLAVSAYRNLFFVAKEFRGVTGRRLQDLGYELLKQRGVTEVFEKSGHRAEGPRLAKWYERMGARDMGRLFCIQLEH